MKLQQSVSKDKAIGSHWVKRETSEKQS